MTELLRPGSGFIYMKVGTHAGEDLSEIIARKRREIEEAGHALWGYGGNTCHPLSRVQPFVKQYEDLGGVIYLVMQPMTSRHFAMPKRATRSSADGTTWQEIPPAINVLGSRYALAIDELREDSFELDLGRTKVAIGNSLGRPGDVYVSGRVDKACLEVVDEPVTRSDGGAGVVRIGLVARLVDPYAVLVD